MNGPHSSTFYWYPTCSVLDCLKQHHLYVRTTKCLVGVSWNPLTVGFVFSAHRGEGKTLLQEERLCAFVKRSHQRALQMEMCLAHPETCSSCFQKLVIAASNSSRNWSLRPGTFVQLVFPSCPPWGSPGCCTWQSLSVPHHCIFRAPS